MKNKTQTQTQAAKKSAVTIQPSIAVEESPNALPVGSREETIRALAHEKWQAAGCPEGDGMGFWLEAERELLSQTSQED